MILIGKTKPWFWLVKRYHDFNWWNHTIILIGKPNHWFILVKPNHLFKLVKPYQDFNWLYHTKISIGYTIPWFWKWRRVRDESVVDGRSVTGIGFAAALQKDRIPENLNQILNSNFAFEIYFYFFKVVFHVQYLGSSIKWQHLLENMY